MSARTWLIALAVSVVLYGGVFASVIGVRHARQLLERGELLPRHVGSVAP